MTTVVVLPPPAAAAASAGVTASSASSSSSCGSPAPADMVAEAMDAPLDQKKAAASPEPEAEEKENEARGSNRTATTSAAAAAAVVALPEPRFKKRPRVSFEAADIVEFEPTLYTTSVTSGGIPVGMSFTERSRSRRRLDSWELERTEIRVGRQSYMEEGYLDPTERESILNKTGYDDTTMVVVEADMNRIIADRRESNETDFEFMFGLGEAGDSLVEDEAEEGEGGDVVSQPQPHAEKGDDGGEGEGEEEEEKNERQRGAETSSSEGGFSSEDEDEDDRA